MDTAALAKLIADKVVSDTSFWVAMVGLFGVLIGAAITAGGNFAIEWWKSKPSRSLDKARKAVLMKMLHDPRCKEHWRKLSTLSRVIGADDATTTRLLIEVQARGSEKDDGFWGLLEYHPLDKIGQ